MKLSDFIKKEAILLGLQAQTKETVIQELVAALAPIAEVQPDILTRVLMDRERIGSTGIGGGVGIPHGRLGLLKSFMLGFGLSRKGVDFESMDGRPTYLFFVMLVPEQTMGIHINVLAHLSKMLKEESFKHRLMQVTHADQVLQILKEQDDIT